MMGMGGGMGGFGGGMGGFGGGGKFGFCGALGSRPESRYGI
jgi:hypothetical protein